MTPIQVNWGSIVVDDYIKSADGTTWRICAVDLTEGDDATTGAFRARNRAGEWTTISPKPIASGVTKMVPEDDAAPYVALLRDTLGAEVLARKDNRTQTVTCEPWPASPPSKSMAPYRTHLEAVHGMYVVDVKGFAKLVEAHEAAHDSTRPTVGKFIPHIHA